MNLVFLGTGTSVGVPAIGCTCPVCTSPDPRNRRLRASLYAQAGGLHLLFDTTPDFRTQALSHGIGRVDAVLFTHAHADHVMGFDDIRRFNTLQDCVIPAYGSPDTIRDLNRIFDYFHHDHPPGVYRPDIEYKPVIGPFSIGPLRITPMPVAHGRKTTLGYRIDHDGKAFGYFPDCLSMNAETVNALRGMDVMILDALRLKPHSTHLCLSESVDVLKRIGAKRSYIIHMGHDIDQETTQKTLPESVFVSYDGLRVEF